MEQFYTYEVREFFRLLGRLWLARLDAELWQFAKALDQWLHSHFEHPTPKWRESFDSFLAKQSAAGRTITPESHDELLEFLAAWEQETPHGPEDRSTAAVAQSAPIGGHLHWQGDRKLRGQAAPPPNTAPSGDIRVPSVHYHQFHRNLAEANRSLSDLEKALQAFADKIDAADKGADIEVESDLEQFEDLIWKHNDAMEKTRDAWLRGDLGGNTFDRLVVVSTPVSLGLPMFLDEDQAGRAREQWRQIGDRLEERIAFLDKVIVAMRVTEAAGDVATALLGLGLLITATKVGGKMVLVKTAGKMVAGAVASEAAGMAVEAGLRAAGASEETIQGVQKAAEVVTLLLAFRKIGAGLLKSANGPPNITLSKSVAAKSPKPAPPLDTTSSVPKPTTKNPYHTQSGDPEIAAVKARTQPYPAQRNPPRESRFRLDRHGGFPKPRPSNTSSHHGVVSVWMRSRFPNYDADKAPAILMPIANHRETVRVFNSWRASLRKRMGQRFDWAQVTEQDIRDLSEKMFDAAQVPNTIRAEYWAWFDRMIAALSK